MVQVAANYRRIVWTISLLLLQAEHDASRNAALAAGGSPSLTAMPNPDSAANHSRLSPSEGNWVNVTSNLAGMPSECGNMSYVSAKPNEDLVIAGVARRGLWGSRDGGVSWQKLGLGGGSATLTNRPSSIIYDPVRPDVFWVSGIYNSNGVYRTDNDGSSLRSLGSVRHNDSLSVDFTDTERRTLLAGGHEQGQMVYHSKDGGRTWKNVGANLPAGTGLFELPARDQFYHILCGLLAVPGAVDRAAFFKATIPEPLGITLPLRAEGHNRLLQVMDRFTGRVMTAPWCEGSVKARIGPGVKPLRAVC